MNSKIKMLCVIPAYLLGVFASNSYAAPPAPLTCDAGYEKVSLDITGAAATAAGAGGTTTLWGPNPYPSDTSPSYTYTLTTVSGQTVNMTIEWQVNNTDRWRFGPGWGTPGYGAIADPSVLTGFNRANNTPLATHILSFSRDVRKLRYVIYNVDRRFSSPAYLDQVQAVGANSLHKWDTGYNTVAGDTVTGSSPSCGAGALCDGARVTAIYDNTDSSSYTAFYRVPTSIGNQTASSMQWAGINNYEACLKVPQKVTLTKSWAIDSVNGDSTSLTLSGGTNAVAGSSSVGGVTTDATIDVSAGDTITLSEMVTAPSGISYQPDYACVDKDNVAVSVTPSGNSATLIVPSGTDVTCTVTNAPKKADISVTKVDASSTYTPGENFEFVITITNSGPDAADGTVFSETVPAWGEGVTWTCSATGATCPNAAGSGNVISETIANFPAGGELVYTVSGTYSTDVSNY